MSEQSVPPAGKPSNPAALTSIICGALLCIPLITSIPAVIFGIVGLNKARREPQAGGRGLAIAGLILGVIGIAGWVTVGIGAYLAYGVAKQVVTDVQAEAGQPGRMLARNFVQKISSGDVQGARDVAAPELSKSGIESISQQIQQLGAFQDLKIDNVVPTTVNGNLQVQLSGTARFAKGAKHFSITVAKDANGLRVVQYSFE